MGLKSLKKNSNNRVGWVGKYGRWRTERTNITKSYRKLSDSQSKSKTTKGKKTFLPPFFTLGENLLTTHEHT